jgi:Small metal-binding protein
VRRPRPIHTEEGIKHLKQAIDEGKEGDATTHAEAALTHLEQAK